MSILLVILIVFFASASSFIPSLAKSLTDNRRRGLKRIKVSGWATIICYIITIGLTCFQFQYNEEENKRKEFKTDSTQIARDAKQRRNYDSSLAQMKNKFDTSNIKIVQAFGEAMGRYGLKLDSAQNRIVRIVKDSSKTKVVLPSVPIASLCIGNQIQMLDSVSFRKLFQINVCAYQAGCTNFKLLCNGGVNNYDGSFTYLGPIDILFPSVKLGVGQSLFKQFRLATRPYYKELFFYVRGDYTNLENTKTYHIDDLYVYSLINKTTLIADGQQRKDMIDFLKDKN